MAKTKHATVLRKLKGIQSRIAAQRDELRVLREEIEAVEDDAMDASDALDQAIDALSRLQ